MTLLHRLGLVFLGGLLLLVAPGQLFAQDEEKDVALKGVDILAPLLPLGMPGDWTPLVLDVDLPSPLDAEVIVGFGLERENLTRRQVKLPANSRKRVTIPLRIPDSPGDIHVLVTGRRGALLARQTLEYPALASDADTLRILVVGEDPLGLTLLREISPLAAPGHRSFSEQRFRPVAVETQLPTQLPGSWFSYSSVDLLVWPDPDPSVLQAEQQQALQG